MKKLELIFKPPYSINDICLGASKKEVKKILGKYDSKDFADHETYGFIDREWYYHHELCIYYDRQGLAELMEVNGYGSDYKNTKIFGIDVFATRADELVSHISKASGTSYLKDSAEFPYTYVFYDLQLTLWRKHLPENDNSDAPLDEFGNGQYFLTIGLATKKCLDELI